VKRDGLVGHFGQVFRLADLDMLRSVRGRRHSFRLRLLIAVLLGVTPLAISPTAAQAANVTEQQGSRGVNTFLNYHNASGVGVRVAPFAFIEISCKVYDPAIASANPDGYWYRVASSPWNNQYYAPANTFMNGDAVGGPFTHNTDFAVPDCGTAAPAITLSKGPAAPSGFRYAITLDNFPAGQSISVNCYDSASPNGFYPFWMVTDGSGHAFTQSYCYSADGPDHWVIAGGTQSNHVSWGATGGTGGGTGGTGSGAATDCPPGSGQARKRGDTNCDGTVRVAIVGDSYISGEGAASGIRSEAPTEQGRGYLSGTDVVTNLFAKPPNACHRSAASWAVREALDLTSAENVLFTACSGAVVDDVTSIGQYTGSPAGVIGARPQTTELLAYNNVRPVDLVFISLGGNDIGFSDIITECITSFCRYHTAWLNRWATDIEAVGARLRYAYSEIAAAASSAQLWVADYPDPLMRKTCGATGLPTLRLGLIDEAEQDWLKSNVVSALDGQIALAASQAKVKFIEMKGAAEGHQVCSDALEWYVNGLKAGNDVPVRGAGPLGAESFHPTAAGHRHMAAIADAAFTADSSFGRTKATVPQVARIPFSRSNASVSNLQGDPNAAAVLQPAAPMQVVVNGLPPSTRLKVVVHSVPTEVGWITTDATGSGEFNGDTPPGLYPGYHSVGVEDAVTGEQLAFGGALVAETSACQSSESEPDADGDRLPNQCDPDAKDGPLGDVDGDGVSNSSDDCPTVSDSAQSDTNQNGRGDACDPSFGVDPRLGYWTSSLYGAVVPSRLLDSRNGGATVDGQFAQIGLRSPGSVTELQVAGRGGVPADAASVVLNVTVDQPSAGGFVTVWPCGTARPDASNLNYATGQTIPNAVISKVGPGGKVCLYTYATTHLIVDVNGYNPS
jgi:GDSL-like Lipase/Acylhydrolase family